MFRPSDSSRAPDVTVVMPTFNGARYLPEALASIEAQRGDGTLEVLAVDDGSTDETPEILRGASARLPLRLIDGPRRRNWVASTNTALREARGAFVCMLHQDDRWHPDRLARLLALAGREPDVGFWVHPARFIGPDGRRVGTWGCPWPKNRALAPAEWLPRLLVQNVLAVPAVFLRRSVLDAVGPMDEAQPYTADWEYWLRIARAHRAWVHPEPLADFRVHADSQTFALARRHDDFVAQLRGVVNRYAGDVAELGAPPRRIAMARLGIEANAWLAARAAGVATSARPLVRAACRAGVRGSIEYVRAAQLVPRIAARLRVARRRQATPPASQETP